MKTLKNASRIWMFNLTALAVLTVSNQVKSQVTIGSDEVAVPLSLLQIKENGNAVGANAEKGIAFPRVELADLSQLKIGTVAEITDADEKKRHTGLVVYNVTTRETEHRLCPGLHEWTGAQWRPLIPYPEFEPQKTLVPGGGKTSLVLLDPANPSDPNYPIWAQIGKNPADYTLGLLGEFTDPRDNEKYHYTRFYVGAQKQSKTYEIKTNCSCDKNGSVWVTTGTTEENEYLFDEGIWMNENIRATAIDPNRDKSGESVASSLTLTGGSSGITSGDLNYPYSYGTPQYGKGTNRGLLYTWGAATNGKAIINGLGPNVTENEGGLNEKEQIQGICPAGWHLPSDKEWTDLQNGIIFKASLFSSEADYPTGTPFGYDDTGHITNPPVGKAMSSGGTSKLPENGGFYDPMAYMLLKTIPEPGAPDDQSFFWTSSATTSTPDGNTTLYRAWIRNITIGSISRIVSIATKKKTGGGPSLYPETFYLFSARCKKNN
ncbi:MAG: fibrobacter succinogenes major paralogous domain-containing protein [Flavobacteriaceae bacterium]|jgi:uncharacterized protein (TIGR02145 family)|nr:fibrobacter succinogenes major paralogous domain-containing protein [Flavobacteriaceae bacterium]